MQERTHSIDVTSVSFDVTAETSREMTVKTVDGDTVQFEYMALSGSLIEAGTVDPEQVDSYPTLTFETATELVADHLFSDLYLVTVVSDTDAVPDIEVPVRDAAVGALFSKDLYGNSPNV